MHRWYLLSPAQLLKVLRHYFQSVDTSNTRTTRYLPILLSARCWDEWFNFHRFEVCDYEHNLEMRKIDNGLQCSTLENILITTANARNLTDEYIWGITATQAGGEYQVPGLYVDFLGDHIQGDITSKASM